MEWVFVPIYYSAKDHKVMHYTVEPAFYWMIFTHIFPHILLFHFELIKSSPMVSNRVNISQKYMSYIKCLYVFLLGHFDLLWHLVNHILRTWRLNPFIICLIENKLCVFSTVSKQSLPWLEGENPYFITWQKKWKKGDMKLV